MAKENGNIIFTKNIEVLSASDPGLAFRLKGINTESDFYVFSRSRSGELVPAAAGKPIHSMFDPDKEAKRLMKTSGNSGFITLFGLGGAYHCKAAMERENCLCLLAVDFNICAFAEILSCFDYSGIFSDPRFHLLIDPSLVELEAYFFDLYKPALHGAFKTIPLRTRVSLEPEQFSRAADVIEKAVEKIKADYSVQSYFGLRWFSNVMRNLSNAVNKVPLFPEITKAAVCAAGPSLDMQLPLLKKQRDDFFLIATDTSFPALKSNGITPDAVISIDCQHYSYYHFMETLPENVLLFLDIASPRLIALRSKAPCFFFGGHPVCAYLSSTLKLPFLDTSGGNVTYAALSLARFLGARSIELFGADFSYPLGLTYARGVYIYGLFQKQQTRLKPLEALNSTFLFRTPLEKKENAETNSWYYETASLRFYRECLEMRNPAGEAEMFPAAGLGAVITPTSDRKKRPFGVLANKASGFERGQDGISARTLLVFYREKIGNLPLPGNKDGYPQNLNDEERFLLNTLLPSAAAVRRKTENTNLSIRQVIEETKKLCMDQINRVLDTV